MIDMMNLKNNNVLQLAYMGDAIYEVYIREFLINKGIVKVNDLQKNAVKYVSAKAQANFLMNLINENFFDDIELEIIKRARNHKSRIPKNTDIVTYKYATSLEAVIGYLYLSNNKSRIDKIMEYILNTNNNKGE